MGKYFIGIDIGASGAIVAMGEDGFVEVFDMPTVKVHRNGKPRNEVSPAAVHSILRVYKGETCFIEQVASRPGQSVSAMFQFGRYLGIVEGVVASCEMPVTMVTPRVWQKAVGLRGGDTKEASRARAMELFPGYADQFSRKKDHGRSDAALIAYYAMVYAAGT